MVLNVSREADVRCLIAMAMVLLSGPAVFAAAADDMDDAFQRLKEAQSKNDAALVKKAALELYSFACEVKSTPAPAADAEKEAWTNRVEAAKSAELFSEYALYATGIQSEASTLIDLISTLEAQNPKSKYLDEAYGLYIVALMKTSGARKATAVAERAIVHFPDNEDLLLHMVSTTMSQKQPDRALGYANRLIGVLNRHPKPQTVQTADWERKRNFALAQAYWTAGVVLGEKGQHLNADKNLRAALPLIKGNDAMLAPALFYLGMANYQLGKMTLSKERVLEGARFSEQAAAIDSPYADQARHNALVMKQEAARIR
jgi:tetratricopeptide (TPR) repeat protein